jgi:putative membrane protein
MANETMEKARTEPGASWTALENTRLAYERTLMAWIRTAVSLISFGFTIYKFFQYFQESRGEQVKRLITPRALGMFMISAGLFALVAATLEHWRSRKRLQERYTGMQVSLAFVLATLISALGILALIAAFFRQ